MTEVNNINNIAREIVSNLDKKDGKADGKIEASIWNKFVCKKEGNEINNYIKTDNAIKSVIAYLKRETAKTGQAIEDVANEWLKKVGGGDKTEIDESKYNKTGNESSIRYVDVKSLVEPGGSEEQCEKLTQNAEEWEKTKEELANVFDDSCQLLMDVANKNYRYKITKGAKHAPHMGDKMYRTATLADGRTIEIGLYKDERNGKIGLCGISIYDDKNGTRLSNEGGAYFITTGGEMYSETSKSGAIHEYDSTRETTKDMWKLAEKIFGEDLKNSFGDDLDFYGYIAWE